MITLIVTILMTVLFTQHAFAAEQELPVNFKADEMDVDRELGIVTARGNVEVTHNERTLLANTISYNQRNDILTASGNVSLLEPSGDVLFAEHMEMSGDFKNGIVSNIRMILSDNSRVAANGARRIDGDLDLRKGVYSPCNLCKDDPSRPPLWQIKAVKIFHDESRRVVEYSDAWLEVAGFPVAYTPYLSHPDPTVKRESGFLTPSFGTSTDLGVTLKTPYFWNVSPQTDATVTPALYGDQGYALAAEVRHMPIDGELEIGGSVADDDTKGARGHIDSMGRFNIDQSWRWGFDANVASDDTYLRRYGFQSNQTLTSNLYTEGFRQRNYVRAEAFYFQGLEAGDDADATPRVAPLISFSHEGTPDQFGGHTTLDASLASLTRDEGVNSHRMSVRPGWQTNYVSSLGESYTLSLNVDADLYYINGYVPEGQSNEFDGFTGRVFPKAKLDWSFPLVRESGSIHQTIEPQASLVIAPNGGNPVDLPNEDSQEFEFDETSLFRNNRFAGHDRVEGGSRIDYGVQWGVYGENGGSTTAFLGQSYRMRTDGTFVDESGLEDHLSDYVAKFDISPSSYLDLLYRTRLSKNNLAVRRNEVTLGLGMPILRFNAQYLFFDRQEDSEFAGREDLSLGLSSQFNRLWRGRANLQHDLADEQTRSIGFGLIYEDECLEFSTSATRSFYEDRDIEPSDTILFTVSFKTLGQISTNY